MYLMGNPNGTINAMGATNNAMYNSINTATNAARESREREEAHIKEFGPDGKGDCIQYAVDNQIPISKECSDKNFEKTWGISKDDFYKQAKAEVEPLREKEAKIGSVFEKEKIEGKALTNDNVKSMVEAGGVFEKQDKEVKGFDQNSLDNNSIKATGIDPETLDRLKKEIDDKEKAHNNEIKHHDTIKGPSLPSMDFVK